MKVFFVNPVSFEPWDYRNPDSVGIGGSETSAIEMSWRLARRGFDVTVYAPLPEDRPCRGVAHSDTINECKWSKCDCPGNTKDYCPTWRGTKWLPLADADFSHPGLWIIYRSPATADKFMEKHEGQTLWLVCQDVDYQRKHERFTEERIAKFDVIMALCKPHAAHLLTVYKSMAGKVIVSGNGVRLDLLREIEATCVRCGGTGREPDYQDDECDACGLELLPSKVRRDPKKIVYASSPDRGLINLLKIFKRAREYDPGLSLTVCYGFDNLDKIIKDNPGSFWEHDKNNMLKLLKQPGVTFTGRIPQPELLRQWLSAGMFVYPTSFCETSCISIMEAQACGAIPIVSPVWALQANLKAGIHIHGDPSEPMTRARFVDAIRSVASNPEQQEKLRIPMMAAARRTFGWERVVDQWEAMARGYDDRFHQGQFAFQLRHATGKVLNLGCNEDPAGFGKRGGINVDAHDHCPITKMPLPIHMKADIREYIPLSTEFETVILGDVLEHMTDEDAVRTLANAKARINGHGRILITCPEDYRPAKEQHLHGDLVYAAGESAYHERPVTRETIKGWLDRAGLREEKHEELDYGFCVGHGVIAR